jgi:hypothetical protein
MIFIRNYSRIIPTSKINLEIDSEKGILNLIIDKKTSPLMNCSIEGIFDSVSRSLKGINKKVGNDFPETKSPLIEGTFTCINIYKKGLKLVYEVGESEKMGAELISKTTEELANGDKKYPRDMIVIIRDKDQRFNFGMRNVVMKKEFELDDEGKTVITVLFPKYPIWGKLKYPVYGILYYDTGDVDYIRSVADIPEEELRPIDGFKLSAVEETNITRNALERVEFSEAYDYIVESIKITREKSKAAAEKQNRNSNGNNDGSYRSRQGRHDKRGVSNPVIRDPQGYGGYNNNRNSYKPKYNEDNYSGKYDRKQSNGYHKKKGNTNRKGHSTGRR